MDGFDVDDIDSVEFCVSVEVDDGTFENYLVPTNGELQDALREMLRTTVAHFDEVEDDIQIGEYELSEKYGPTEPLTCAIDHDAMQMPRALFDEEGFDANPGALDDPQEISHYFVVYRDGEGRKLVAVRRAAQFKGLLKTRVITWLDDSLRLVDDRVFKLDHDFDFLIIEEAVHILHPKSFEYVAAIEAQIVQKSVEKAQLLGEEMDFLDTSGIETFVVRHKRAARLISSLIARGGLDEVDRGKLRRRARENGVELKRVGNKIAPTEGHEIGFLELLDDRRYIVDLRGDQSTAYVASSRRRA